MGRNSGKRTHRKVRFAPPKVPKSEELKAHQCYGVITKYHGGAQRRMDVTIYDSESNSLQKVKCSLKASLRHFKCKQRVQTGSFVVTDYEDVIMIFTPNQHASIPESTFIKLNTVSNKVTVERVETEDIHFLPEYDLPPSDDDDDTDIVFIDPDAPSELRNETVEDNIDLI